MTDVVVLGGGPGGYAAAIRVSQLGGRAVLVSDEIGGTCVNRGCIPTKVWHRAAYLIHSLNAPEEFGLKAAKPEVDLSSLKFRMDGVAGDIRRGMESLLGNNEVEVIFGRAVLKGPQQIEVDGRIVEAGKIILAPGSRPAFPEINGLEDALLTTNQALELAELPSSILIWGAGPIETEMAAFFNRFGTKVYLATPDPRILPREDGETSVRIMLSLKELGVEVFTGHHLESIKPDGQAFKALLSGPQEPALSVDRVLVGSRAPNTSGLGLEAAGIELEDDGAIKVNERLETTAPGVYAIGDAIGGWMLSHAASAMAVTAAENAMGAVKKFPFHLVPRCIWTIPEVGALGLSEDEAEAAGHDVEIGVFPYPINGLAMVRGEVTGAVKIVFDTQYGEILGVHIVGANATELVGEAVLAMQLECTVQELAAGMRSHPTFSEAIVDAARAGRGWALYLPRQ